MYYTTLVLFREAFTIITSSKKKVLGDLNQNVPSSNTKNCTYYRKRGSASYIVREVLSVREREKDTERERERERERRK